MQWRTIVGIGAVLAGLGVVLGAFAAHSLKANISPYGMGVFETGARYQMYHSLAILVLGSLARGGHSRLLNISAHFFIIGILIFSGSLYLLALTEVKWFGAITPIGGVTLIVAWALLAIGVWGRERKD